MEFENIKLEIFPEVYEPAEDSFLLAKYAKTLNGDVLEIGCGCGIASLACAKSNSKNSVLGVDINPKAVSNSAHNAALNKIKNALFIQSNLFSNVNGKFDAIMFNPPYLPTTKKEKLKDNLNYAFDGGKTGRETTDIFISSVKSFLKPHGVVLQVESSLAGIEKTMNRFSSLGFKTKILEQEKFFFEKLAIISAKL
ncbi:methyltransferase [Candidatus Micrarchaeota archaeon]|nr:methyltransferase [Candidatus Micrarchaeota archaeon]